MLLNIILITRCGFFFFKVESRSSDCSPWDGCLRGLAADRPGCGASSWHCASKGYLMPPLARGALSVSVFPFLLTAAPLSQVPTPLLGDGGFLSALLISFCLSLAQSAEANQGSLSPAEHGLHCHGRDTHRAPW